MRLSNIGPIRPPPDPTLIIGALLALGVIRSIEREKAVDNFAELRGITGCPSNEEPPDA
jgi:hypothetical protein